MGDDSQPAIAVVGAGLAGLAAAYTLSRELKGVRIHLFEKESRIGGRVLTSSRPRGEHGAEFVLWTENTVKKFLKALKISKGPDLDWGACRFRGLTKKGSYQDMAKCTMHSGSSLDLVTRVVARAKRANSSDRYPKGRSRGNWLDRHFALDPTARRFLRMILAGETCAPWSHQRTARTTLGCLDESDTRRIAGGTEQLVHRLREATHGAKVTTRGRVTSVRRVGGEVLVSWRKGARLRRDRFQAAIVTVPESRSLLRELPPEPRRTHYHAYVSVLIEYATRWWMKSLPELAHGLYTDGKLNFIEEVPGGVRGRHVLRILQPNAQGWLKLRNRQIRARCLDALRELAQNGKSNQFIGQPTRCRIQRWPHGLACGGSETHKYHKAGLKPPIYLAGDRFSRWPSMDGALESGRSAALQVIKALKGSRA